MVPVGCIIDSALGSLVHCQVLVVPVTSLGFLEAGRRQEVTEKSRASGVESSPWVIPTPAGQSRLGR